FDRWIASKNSEVCSRPEIRGYFRPSLEAASGTKLSDSQLRAAKTAGLELAAGGEPTVRSLVECWALVEGLEDFAAAVKAAMMPA
ncbi:hypothetical protein, partial [Pseudomonas aeruginosa]|uniref:hypothetical protein n=4 Tax=Pseudomonas aeruginosa TaxID=287 RepID=UPI001C8AC06C